MNLAATLTAIRAGTFIEDDSVDARDIPAVGSFGEAMDVLTVVFAVASPRDASTIAESMLITYDMPALHFDLLEAVANYFSRVAAEAMN